MYENLSHIKYLLLYTYFDINKIVDFYQNIFAFQFNHTFGYEILYGGVSTHALKTGV